MIVDDYKIKWTYSSDAEGNAITFCHIDRENSEHAGPRIGAAACSPNDQHNKDVGRKIALQRAMEHRGMNKATRTKIWEAYRNLTKVPRW
jgi:hypothetical protein